MSAIPEATARAFRDGWFYPGDTGSLRADGMLIIHGREASVLNIGGDKIRPELVEEALTSFPGVEQAAAFTHKSDMGVPELWAALVCRPDSRSGGASGALRKPARARVRAPRHFNRLGIPLPVSAAGKLDRAAAGRTGEARPGVIPPSTAQIRPQFGRDLKRFY